MALTDTIELAMRAKATYIYCLIHADRRPRLGQGPAGLPGLGACRVVDAGRGLWLVVADAPLPRFGEVAIERGIRDLKWLSKCAVAHEAVVEFWLRARAVVPMKLFTIFENDERALADINGKRPKLDGVIRRVLEKREWGVRIRQVEPARSARIVRRASSGAEYLATKKRAHDAERERAARGAASVHRTFSALSSLAAESERRPAVSGGDQPSRLLLDAAFLVDLGRTVPFRAAVRRAAREGAAAGYRVEMTGPWPPYNFIES